MGRLGQLSVQIAIPEEFGAAVRMVVLAVVVGVAGAVAAQQD